MMTTVQCWHSWDWDVHSSNYTRVSRCSDHPPLLWPQPYKHQVTRASSYWSMELILASDWSSVSVANAEIYAGVSGHCVRVLSNWRPAVSGSGGRNNDTGWHLLSDSLYRVTSVERTMSRPHNTHLVSSIRSPELATIDNSNSLPNSLYKHCHYLYTYICN